MEQLETDVFKNLSPRTWMLWSLPRWILEKRIGLQTTSWTKKKHVHLSPDDPSRKKTVLKDSHKRNWMDLLEAFSSGPLKQTRKRNIEALLGYQWYIVLYHKRADSGVVSDSLYHCANSPNTPWNPPMGDWVILGILRINELWSRWA